VNVRVVCTTVAALMAACGGSSARTRQDPGTAAAAARGAFVRVNQVGTPSGSPVLAHVMTRRAAPRGAVAVLRDGAGREVERAPLGRDRGRWSAAFPHVYDVQLPPAAPGAYTVAFGTAASPSFRVAGAHDLFAPPATAELSFLRAQRDGADVDPSILGRQPSDLSDAHASLYAVPRFSGTQLAGPLRRTGGPVDVAGGWMDAGDTLKYAETTSFSEVLLLTALRDDSAALDGAQGLAEARHGMDWLLKLWDPARHRLIYQVGLGDGDGRRILGAHDARWALPETTPRGPRLRYVRDRPVFAATGPVSPNLAGRMAAAYALGAQVFGSVDPAYAARCLDAARTIFAQARTHAVGRLVTAAPHAFYPEREWRDDMELGAAEIQLAQDAAGGPRTGPALDAAARWADAYAYSPLNGTDTFNLYDVAALAHGELARALGSAGLSSSGKTSVDGLANDLRGQLRLATRNARRDPFGYGAYRDDDSVQHMLGLAIEEHVLAALGGAPAATAGAAAAAERSLVLGDNAWGASFVVGAGSAFPRCLHDPVANLSGSLDGRPPLMTGAAVPGPADVTELRGLTRPDGARRCPTGADPYRAFSGLGAGYVDTVSSPATSEPSLDIAALALLAFAQAAQP
jgi:endoglucanase